MGSVNMKYFVAVVKKELLEIIRDKNSFVMSLILMLIIPFVIIRYGVQQNNINNVVISENAENMEALCEMLNIPYNKVADDEIISIIQNGKASLGIKCEKGKYYIIFDETSEVSLNILNSLNEVLECTITNKDLSNRKIVYEGLSFYSNSHDILAMMLPILLVFSVLTGIGNGIAFNIFTGEKERGSFEALLLTQIKRSVLLLAKISVIALVMFFSAIVYLLTILFSVEIVNETGNNITNILLVETSSIFFIIITLATFSGFASSYVTLISLKAKNIREVQLSSMLLSLLFCGLGIWFSVNFSDLSSSIIIFIPIVNTMQTLSHLFEGNVDYLLFLGTNIVNFISILVGIKFGTNIMNQD